MVESAKVAISLLVAGLIWWLVAASGLVSPDLLDDTGLGARAAVELYDDGLLFEDLRASLGRAAVGFVIGGTLGVTVGLLTSRTRVVRFALNPILSLCHPIPGHRPSCRWQSCGSASAMAQVFRHLLRRVPHRVAGDPSRHGARAGDRIRASRSLGAPLGASPSRS